MSVQKLPSLEPSLPDHVFMVSFVFADAFDQFGVGEQRERNVCTPWFRIGFRIIERNLNLHPAKVDSSETLRDAQCLCVRVARIIKPALVIKSDSFRNKSIAFPFPNGISEPTGIGFRRMSAAVAENLSKMVELF